MTFTECVLQYNTLFTNKIGIKTSFNVANMKFVFVLYMQKTSEKWNTVSFPQLAYLNTYANGQNLRFLAPVLGPSQGRLLWHLSMFQKKKEYCWLNNLHFCQTKYHAFWSWNCFLQEKKQGRRNWKRQVYHTSFVSY